MEGKNKLQTSLHNSGWFKNTKDLIRSVQIYFQDISPEKVNKIKQDISGIYLQYQLNALSHT